MGKIYLIRIYEIFFEMIFIAKEESKITKTIFYKKNYMK